MTTQDKLDVLNQMIASTLDEVFLEHQVGFIMILHKDGYTSLNTNFINHKALPTALQAAADHYYKASNFQDN
jgi:hypothetical protein